MSITAERKSELINNFKRNDVDSGSPEVQVAILTDRIKALTEHLKANKHDYACRRGLTLMVSKRMRLLKYLANKDRNRYLEVIQRLGLRR